MIVKPLVSVVMSVYNGKRYLHACLDSILAQEGVEFEVVVVNDGSTDGSSAILEEYERKDARVRVFRQENAGLTRALARGCGEARGPLIARQDDDDISMPGRLAKLAAVLQDQAAVAVVSSWVESTGPSDEILMSTQFPEGLKAGTEGVLRGRRNPVHGSTMFRKADLDAIGGYRPEFYFAQDSDLWLRLADRGGFLFLPEALYRFRIVDGSITANHRDAQVRLYELAKACRQARIQGQAERPFLDEAALIRPGTSSAGRPKRGAATYLIGRLLLKNGDMRASAYLRSYVRQSPLDPKGWISLLQVAFLQGRTQGHIPTGRNRGDLP